MPQNPPTKRSDSASASGKSPSRVSTKALPLIEIKASWCKACGLCVDYCNRGVLKMEGTLPKVVDLEKCTRCLMCEAVCPDFAIRVSDAGPGASGGKR